MTLSSGSRLGPYEVLAPLGAGGMGEVYRARDSKLRREVAVKVLPASFSKDPERLARFEREAQLLASLNHPNIGAIYGLEESEGVRFLVLELVLGETLADCFAAGPLPVEEALSVSRQIAEALEAAHEKGIIHRDLKPANVKVTPEGKVKVLDFGLAKAFGVEPSASDLTHSPTVTHEGTREGVILGTAAYMSPEQARGKSLDKRTDIWSFGCVLYETLTGRQTFAGETVSDILAAILGREPDWLALPGTTPPKIRDLLRRCLQKDPARRLRDVGDARIEIEEALAGPEEITPAATSAQRPARWQRALPWGVAGLMVVAAGVAIWSSRRATAPAARPAARLLITLPATESLDLGRYVGERPAVALSPDGRRVVYAASSGGVTRLYMRAMDQLEAMPIAGTEGASGPFFSPDGQWVGFFTPDTLKKVSLIAGTTVSICHVPSVTRGASWSPDEVILFTPTPADGLSRVSASGGIPQVVTTPDTKTGELAHLWPEILPGGKTVLFTIRTGRSFDDARIAVQSLESGERRLLEVEGGTSAHYAPTGHLVYARGGTLLAVPFDLAQLRVTGRPVPILEGVRVDPTSGAAQFSLSGDGTLVYVRGGAGFPERSLLWVDRRGATRPVMERRLPFQSPSFSPDAQRLAVTIEGITQDAWVYELARGILTRLTFDPNEEFGPIWTPDGKRVTFASYRVGEVPNLFWKPADGSSAEERLTTTKDVQFPSSWSPDGRVLAFTRVRVPTIIESDIWVLPLSGDRKPQPLVRTPFEEYGAMFSPDGRWIAYVSNESGRNEVYLQPFTGSGGKRQISTDGGTSPVWARSGRELFYRNADKMMAVSITTQPAFAAAPPRLLFQGAFEEFGRADLPRNYDIAPDGERFVMIRSEQQSTPTQLNVVLNWFEELKRRVPSGKK